MAKAKEMETWHQRHLLREKVKVEQRKQAYNLRKASLLSPTGRRAHNNLDRQPQTMETPAQILSIRGEVRTRSGQIELVQVEDRELVLKKTSTTPHEQ